MAEPTDWCAKGPVEFRVTIVFDRNSTIQDPKDPQKIHRLGIDCFPLDRPVEITLLPLGELENRSGPELLKHILERVNARALLSAALALTDAHFEQSLLKLQQL